MRRAPWETATRQAEGIQLVFFIVIAVALTAWYVLERTPVGRRVYATGSNPEAARLAGIDMKKIAPGTFVLGGLVAAPAGVLRSSELAAGDPTLGRSYLLPAVTAAFLRPTRFRGGRFNAWGTVGAVPVPPGDVTGLQLIGGPFWLSDLFNGVALTFAVGLTKVERRRRRGSAISGLIRRNRAHAAERRAGGPGSAARARIAISTAECNVATKGHRS